MKLNTILHPIIVKRIQEKIGDLAKSGKTRILLDAPTLFESGADKLFTRTVAVLADEEVRRRRIMERYHLTEEEALRRIKAQHPESYYRVRSSYSLRNNGTPEQLEKEAQPIIDRLEKGYDTEMGQGGVNVSGGQKQRLCIARAILKKPKVLILDDSTSAVDTATEAKIREMLQEKLPHMTKIIIAQRITSVRHADKIIVLDDGRIKGIGTHEELLADNQIYQEIYDSQKEGADL